MKKEKKLKTSLLKEKQAEQEYDKDPAKNKNSIG